MTTTKLATLKDRDLYDVHEARALVRGLDECTCGGCKRVRKAEMQAVPS